MRNVAMAFATVAAIVLLGGCLPIELSVAPDGRVLIPRNEGFFTYDAKTGAVKRAYAAEGIKPNFATFAPDGTKFLAISEAGDGGFGGGFAIEVVDEAGKAKRISTDQNVTYATWSPTGEKAAITRIAQQKHAPMDENMPELAIIDPAAGTSKAIAHNVSVIHRWLPGGKTLLALQLTSKNEETDLYTGALVRIDASSGEASPIASVISGKSVHIDVAADGKKALLSVFQAAKAGAKLAMPGEDDEVDTDATTLYTVDLATGEVAEAHKGASYAKFSPDGKHVLIATPSDDEGLKLEVADSAMSKTTTIADGVMSEAGGLGQSVDVYASWLSNDTVIYLTQRAVYGTAGLNITLTSVGIDGKGEKNHQPIIDSAVAQAIHAIN